MANGHIPHCPYFSGTYQSSFRLDQWPILAVHLVVQSARIAQIVAGTVASPQRRRRCAAVDTLATLCSLAICVVVVVGGGWG